MIAEKLSLKGSVEVEMNGVNRPLSRKSHSNQVASWRLIVGLGSLNFTWAVCAISSRKGDHWQKRNLIIENANVISVKESGSALEGNSEIKDQPWSRWNRRTIDGGERAMDRNSPNGGQNQVGRTLKGKVIWIEKKSSAGERDLM